MRLDILGRKEEILGWVEDNKSKTFICKQLRCKPTTLENYLAKLDIVYKGNQGGKGYKVSNKKLTPEEYSKTLYPKAHLLKLKLIEFGVKEHKCELCEITTWNGKPAPLELHHIDGNHFNNNISNLQILCPNCHAQCDNNSGKAKYNYAPVSQLAEDYDLESYQ